MTNEQTPMFYAELNTLCAQYEIEGFVGLWFSGTTDNYGFIHGSPTGSEKMTTLCAAINEKLREFCDGVYKGPDNFTVQVLVKK